MDRRERNKKDIEPLLLAKSHAEYITHMISFGRPYNPK